MRNVQRVLAICCCACAIAAHVPALAQAPATPQRLVACPGALEAILPGEYYFCIGGKEQLNGCMPGALDHLQRAASWANKPSQYLLGLIHFQGDGVPIDRPLGLAWLRLAAERDNLAMVQALRYAERHATPAERRMADALHADMATRYADAVAVPRAAVRFERETRELRRIAAFSPLDSMRLQGLPSVSASRQLAVVDALARESFGDVEGKVEVGDLEILKPMDPTSP